MEYPEAIYHGIDRGDHRARTQTPGMEAERIALSAQRKPGESKTGSPVAGRSDDDAGLCGVTPGDGQLGLRLASAEWTRKKCKHKD